MTPKSVVARWRADVLDTLQKPLWSDAEVCGYLHDAQQRLCRDVGGIRDSTSAVTSLPYAIGDHWVTLDPSILQVRSARLASNGRPVSVVSYEDIVGMDATTHAWPFNPTEIDLTGPVRSAIIGMDEDRLRLVRIPNTADTLLLVVERLPLVSLAVDRVSALPDEFEVREEHHLALMLWMKHLGYSKQDAETFDGGKADDYERKWNVYCEKAADEKRRRNSKPRLIAYGGL